MASASASASASGPSPTLGPSLNLRGSSPVPDRPLSLSRLSSQDRLSGILETARERADTIGSQTSGRSARMSFQRVLKRDDDGAPDETTIIATARGNATNYQSMRTSPNPRNRRPVEQSELDCPVTNGTNGTNCTNGTNGVSPHTNEKKNWLKHCLSGVWSVELENKGSVARDHLALERTFLAWLRTSLSFASIGIAITQLFRLNATIAPDDPHFQTIRHIGKPLGATFIGISILILLLGYRRYYQGQQWVIKGKFPASRGTIIIVSLVACALIVVSLFVVLFTQPTSVGSS
ncbi:hypothetical protein F4813DRAFT_351400 [Daldinia decipiens]|uniref:uncharacterized protein n=1 Tax=Daldinia decipiens TaxID=326647 RepID=UPI0020C37836|nr:uncharacterized protein F4813DRAFT_351400 [Daldinia decipiens]KAI1660238.1 hypothetical protein F4813DRAFT_351400 [Daldinia decipiens]